MYLITHCFPHDLTALIGVIWHDNILNWYKYLIITSLGRNGNLTETKKNCTQKEVEAYLNFKGFVLQYVNISSLYK